jgi:hypothetical protein
VFAVEMFVKVKSTSAATALCWSDIWDFTTVNKWSKTISDNQARRVWANTQRFRDLLPLS